MQLMPATARQYGVSNSYDPKSNLEAGVRHLKDLLSRLDLPLALAAYNAGEATIRRYGGLPPFPETQSYVRNILRVRRRRPRLDLIRPSPVARLKGWEFGGRPKSYNPL